MLDLMNQDEVLPLEMQPSSKRRTGHESDMLCAPNTYGNRSLEAQEYRHSKTA